MKSNMSGNIKAYRNMFKQIMDWDEPMGLHNDLYAHGTHPALGNEDDNFLYGVGWSMGDMGFHGWTGDVAKNENDIYKRIEIAYWCLLKSLAEAIGYDYEKYDKNSSVYKYHLKDLNVDEILKWKDVRD